MLKKVLKRFGARTQLCFTSLVIGKASDMLPLSLIWPRWFSCSRITICIRFSGRDKSFHDRPLSCAAHRVKNFFEVSNSGLESLVLYLPFFHELTEHNVCRVSIGSVATQTLWKVFFGDGWYETAEQNSGKYSVIDGE